MEGQIRSPAADELPTKAQLNRATVIAAGVAATLLITTILPAEYGLDPTGIGTGLGLTPMGKMKREQALNDRGARGAARNTSKRATDAKPVPVASSSSMQAGEITLSLAPDEGREVKATMKAGAELQYEWSTSGPAVDFELHGEEFGAKEDDYSTYKEGASARERGTFRAPFDGTHGWYWHNQSSAPLTITVRVKGQFDRFDLLGA